MCCLSIPQNNFKLDVEAIARGEFALPNQDGRTVFDTLPEAPFESGQLHKGALFWKEAAEAARLTARDKELLLGIIGGGLTPVPFYEPLPESKRHLLRGVRAMPDPLDPSPARRMFPVIWLQNHPLPAAEPGLPDPALFLHTEIKAMEAAGAVRRVATRPQLTLPLGIALNRTAGRWRAIYDARQYNLFQRVPEITFPTLADLVRWLEPGWVLTSMDLKSAYYGVAIPEEWQTLFGFHYEGHWYVYCVMPFGVSCGPFVFQLIISTFGGAMREWLRPVPFATIGYIDDLGLGMPPEWCDPILWAFARAMCLGGMVVSIKKTPFMGSVRMRLLGLLLDTALWAYRVPDDKRKRLLDTLTTLLASPRHTVRQLQHLCGFVISLRPAIPPALLLVRPIFAAITEAMAHGDTFVAASAPGVRQALQDLLDFELWEVWHRWGNDSHVHTVCVATDACESGYGAWIVDEVAGTQTFYAAPVRKEDDHHTMMFKEGTALEALLSTDAAHALRGRRVRFLIDNVAAQAAVGGRGSRHAPLQDVARDVLLLMRHLNIACDSDVDRVTSEDNEVADGLSRLGLPSDAAAIVASAPLTREAVRTSVRYGLPPPAGHSMPDIALVEARFLDVQVWAGRTFTVDLCASPADRRVRRFVARYNWNHPDQVATNVLAFAPGPTEFCYVAPPWRLIAPVWRHLRDCKAVGVALIPYAPTSVWWSAVFAHVGQVDPSNVVLVASVGSRDAYVSCASATPALTGCLRSDLLAVAFDFSRRP